MRGDGYALPFLIGGLLAVSLITPAQSETLCGDRDTILEMLSKRHSESPVAAGVTNVGALVEVLSREDGNFTIIITSPKGRSCLIMAGEGWRMYKKQVSQDPEA